MGYSLECLSSIDNPQHFLEKSMTEYDENRIHTMERHRAYILEATTKVVLNVCIAASALGVSFAALVAAFR